jgi:hypothetical protein
MSYLTQVDMIRLILIYNIVSFEAAQELLWSDFTRSPDHPITR